MFIEGIKLKMEKNLLIVKSADKNRRSIQINIWNEIWSLNKDSIFTEKEKFDLKKLEETKRNILEQEEAACRAI